MTTPRIGVTGMWSNQIHGLRFDGSAVASAILRSVVRAGGEPLTLFAEGASHAAERLAGLDALLVPGGFDVDPARYGEEPLDTTVTADFPEQDGFEAGLLAAAIGAGLPVLAICRGFQLLNVEYGGTMIQELPSDSVHRNGVHEVHLAPGSVLAGVLGADSVGVSSYHHQAVGAIGDGLSAVGSAPDGIVEALELPGHELIAVQWHPEDTSATDPIQQGLFDWLVDRAKEHRSKGVSQ